MKCGKRVSGNGESQEVEKRRYKGQPSPARVTARCTRHGLLLSRFAIFLRGPNINNNKISHLVHGGHLTINWTQVGSLPIGWETHLDNPPGVPLAFCSCDLTSNFCDLSCCCDKDCYITSATTSSCLSSDAQDQRQELAGPYMCKYFGPFAPEWRSFFCPVKENTPYLGLFYPPHQIIRDFQKFMSRVSQQYYSYKEEGVRAADQEYHHHYVYGEQVVVGKDVGGTVVQGPLLLPQPVLAGVCVDTFPVHFLEDLSHKCSISVTSEKCGTEAALSATSYLQPSQGAASGSPPGFWQVIGNLSSLGLLNASVEYEWMEDITRFIKVQGGGIPTARSQDTSATLEESTMPYLDADSGWCNNVVLSVGYHFAWEGPAIIDIAVTITLGNIPVSPEHEEDTCSFTEKNPACSAPRLTPFSATPQVYLLQHFLVKFHHIGSSGNASGNFSDLDWQADDIGTPSLSERSGNAGYLTSKPLLAGFVLYNSTEEENSSASGMLSVALNDSTGLYVWRPDESGSCHTSRLEKVTFGIDTISSCQYSWSDASCSDLKGMLEAALYSLVQAEVISTFGWPNITREEDFLPIIFGQHKDNTTTGTGCDVPSSLEYWIIYQDVLDNPGPAQAVHQVVGASAR
ncbi:Tectonic-2 [Portunus trituberculatus]|uniref:Tectonic-2 n=1 Tax=Portunus trituberculatus TaxID=210409 RepID=A0A5B7CJ90_PORTR|nr:Tectonic-2 [Portunus trituberculatus]